MQQDLKPREGAAQEAQGSPPAGARSLTVAALRDGSGEAMLWCPVCSQRLQQRKCKLICERCGYYMSCADYY